MNKVLNELYESRPYLLVVYSELGLSAAYNRRYELMFEGASERLLAYAAQWHTQVKLGFTLSGSEQRPSWMSPGLEEQCVSYHLYRGAPSERELRGIPAR